MSDPHFSIVIPTYNRLNNIQLALAALANQQNPPPFEVIIADDGSTDGTRAFCESRSEYLRYFWCGPNLGFRPHRTRNIGIAQARGKYVVLIDSDILLNPQALATHAELRQLLPDVVIIGLYHFAAEGNLEPEEVADFDQVMALVPPVISPGPPVPGLDCRSGGFYDTATPDHVITEYDGLGFFGGNQCWPTDLWWTLGGQDELMPSGMGEDAEMGQNMRVNQIPVLQYAPVWGVHYHHPRDMKKSRELVQKSILHIDKKYGIGTYAARTQSETDPREMNLSLWYTKRQEAIPVRIADEHTVYAIDGTREHYVGLPEPFWLELLGFSPEDVQKVDAEFLSTLKNEGVIQK